MNKYVTEALKLVTDDRRKEYGPIRPSFERISNYWSEFLRLPITAEQVAIMMILFKIAREQHQHKDDNVVDIIGYAALLGDLLAPPLPTPPPPNPVEN